MGIKDDALDAEGKSRLAHEALEGTQQQEGSAGVEEDAVRTAGPDSNPDPLATTKLGITLRGLRLVRQLLRERFGEGLGSLSTAQVISQWVVPASADRRCRLVEARDIVPAEDVAPPHYFISHAWGNRLELLFDYLDAVLGAAKDTTTVWLDALSVNQHSGTLEQKNDVAAFKDVVAECSGGTIVVMDVAVCNPATRGWCIYEWAATLAIHGPDGMHMQLAPADRSTVFSMLDVSKAQTQFPADKEIILADVVQQHGSVDAFNYNLRLQLLLEPLSYSVDISQLLARSEGTVWDWARVEEWLAEVPAGPDGGGHCSRALVVAAGAGAGKSSVSAALVAEGGPLRRLQERGGAAAWHFIKYSDQRRLDPVRTIKSLAFQLARRLQSVREVLLTLDAAEVAQLHDVDQAFDMLLLKPLQAHAEGGGAQVVLLLDALDEADPAAEQRASAEPVPAQSRPARSAAEGVDGTGPETRRTPLVPRTKGNSALSLLTSHLVRLPACVRFILTTRPDAAAGQVLPCLRRTFAAVSQDGGAGSLGAGPNPTGGRLLELSPQSFRRPPEVEREPSASVPQGCGTEAMGGGGGGSAGGGVLLCSTVAHLCWEVGESAGDPAAAGAAQRFTQPLSSCGGAGGSMDDVNDLYRHICRVAYRQLDDARRDDVSRLLAVLLAAQEPLSESFLEQMGLAHVLPLLPGWRTLFFSAEHHIYTLHKSLADFLLGDVGGGGGRQQFLGSLADGHLAIASLLAASRHAPGDYCLRHLVHHLAAALEGATAEPSFAAAVERIASSRGVKTSTAGTPEGSGQVRSSRTAAASSRASALMDETLSDLRFLARLLAAGDGLHLVRALGDLRADRHTALSREVLLWLRNGQLNLLAFLSQASGRGGARGSDDGGDQGGGGGDSGGGDDVCVKAVAASVLRSAPLPSRLHRLTEAVHGHDWRLRLVLPWLPPYSGWPKEALKLQGFCARVKSLSWSPDGRQLACAAMIYGSSGMQRSLFVWDTATGHCLAELPAQPRCFLQSVEWSPDGRRIAGATFSSVHLWDVASGQVTAVLEEEKGGEVREDGLPFLCRWRPGDARLLATCGYDKRVRLWDADTQQVLVEQVLSARASCMAWSPDGTRLAAAPEGGSITILDFLSAGSAPELRCSVELKLPDARPLEALDWTWEGACLVSAARDGQIRIWNVATARCCSTWPHEHASSYYSPMLAVSRSPKRLWIASAGEKERALRVWSAASGRLLLTRQLDFMEQIWQHPSLQWSPDCRQLACAVADQVHVWEMEDLALDPTLQVAGSVQQASPAPRRSAGAFRVCSTCLSGEDPAVVRSPAQPQPRPDVMQAPGEKAAVVCVAWSPDGRHLASGGKGFAHVWDAASRRRVGCVDVPPGVLVSSVGWSADRMHFALGLQVASNPMDELMAGLLEKPLGVLVYDANTCRCECKLETMPGPVSLGWSPDGSRLAFSGPEKSVRVWDVSSGADVARLQGHTEGFGTGGVVSVIAWSPDGQLLASGGRDGAVYVWVVAQGAHRAVLKAAPWNVRGLAWSPDGKRLASCAQEPVVRVWDWASGTKVAELEIVPWSELFGIAWGPSGGLLACACFDGRVVLVDTASGKQAAALVGHSDRVVGLEWAPGGRQLASCSHDGSVRIWDREEYDQ